MAVDVPGPFATKDELDAALGIFEATAEAHPTDAEAHLNIGLLAKRRSKLAVAAEALRRVVELRPSDDDAKRNLAGVLVDMGYVDDAEVWLRDLISREPPVQPNTRPTRTEAQLANLLLDGRGERSAALRVFERACRCGPTPLAFLAGVVADSLGDHSAAMAFYQQSWRFDPDEEASLHLMISHLRTGDTASADALRARLPAHMLSSTDYVLSTAVAMQSSMHYFTYDMIRLALENAPPAGLVLEFGVYHGKSIRMLAAHLPEAAIHGFDTFSGIPEDWHHTRAGTYSTYGALPQAPDNVHYRVGLFSQTLPSFLDAHPGPG